MPACTVGDPDFEKCGGFSDVVCEVLDEVPSAGEEEAVCHPFCTKDADCKSGHYCNRMTGLCTSEQSNGVAFGASCATASADCQGECVAISAESLCTHRCVLGAVDDCGDDKHPGVCFFAGDSESVGDVGFCSELCNTDADCSASGLTCELFGDEELEATFQHRGVCNVASRQD